VTIRIDMQKPPQLIRAHSQKSFNVKLKIHTYFPCKKSYHFAVQFATH